MSYEDLKNWENLSEEERHKQVSFYAKHFFLWNSGVSTPKAVLQLSKNLKETGSVLEDLKKDMNAHSRATSKNAKALNWLTFALIVVTAVNVIITIFK